ncbi:hypothetical protein PAPYR_9373 [Paratrimastix pyriformis]|uniref:Uncharacterized protein n=1 Tax=Paratrimastix pyriformis TaxID=342808 RepID=A0ABQ8U8I2_9EUKA|nr:hypothetical protein PAPYR_9373 [Paratrimastix pyriformis]
MSSSHPDSTTTQRVLPPQSPSGQRKTPPGFRPPVEAPASSAPTVPHSSPVDARHPSENPWGRKRPVASPVAASSSAPETPAPAPAPAPAAPAPHPDVTVATIEPPEILAPAPMPPVPQFTGVADIPPAIAPPMWMGMVPMGMPMGMDLNSLNMEQLRQYKTYLYTAQQHQLQVIRMEMMKLRALQQQDALVRHAEGVRDAMAAGVPPPNSIPPSFATPAEKLQWLDQQRDEIVAAMSVAMKTETGAAAAAAAAGKSEPAAAAAQAAAPVSGKHKPEPAQPEVALAAAVVPVAVARGKEEADGGHEEPAAAAGTPGMAPAEKKLRTLRKKLADIDELVERKNKGEKLNKDQWEKIKRRYIVVEDIRSLSGEK